MKITYVAPATALLLALASAPVLAGSPGQPGTASDPFDAMDTNHDGYVSLEEFRAASDARRAERRKELEKKRAERRKERSRHSNMEDSAHYSAMDTNKDGRVSHEEFEAYRKQKQQEHARKRAEHKARVEERRKEMQENSAQFRKDAEHVQEHDMGAPGNTGGTGSGR